MKIWTTFIAVILLSAFSAIAGPKDVRVRLYLYDDSNTLFDKLVFGIDDEATNGYDSALGEGQFPCFDVMAFNARFVVAEDCSYIDLREVPQVDDTISHTYSMNVEWRGSSTLKILWYNMPAYIDSAYIMDDYGLNRIFAKMGKMDSVTIDNNVFEKFKIKVWYNLSPVSVEEDFAGEYEIYPNPSSIEIRLNSRNISGLTVIDNYGIKLISVKDKNYIEISSLNSGTYMLHIDTYDGNKIIKKFIKY